MEEIHLKFDGIPVPLARPRFGKRGHVYTPEKCQSAKRSIAIDAMKAMRGMDPLTVPLSVEMIFTMKMPKKPKKNQLKGCHHVSTPDLSNLIKLVEDALNGVVWKDDSIISELRCWKRYGSEPSTIVRVKVGEGEK
jgi:Holliday junction resolvase RusA-like endonuclease